MLASRTDEAIIKIVASLELLYGDVIRPQETRTMLESILSSYDITEKSTALTVLDDLPEKIFLYLASRKIDGLSNITLQNYNRGLQRFSRYVKKNVAEITANDIRIYIAHYAKTGVKDTTLASASDILRGFFNWLEDEDYILKSPMRKIKPMKVSKRLREALTKEEFEVLRQGATTLRQKALLEFLYSTGCRLDETVNVDKNNIDWQRLQLRVIGKGDKERVVYINATAKVHIRKYLMSRLDDCPALFVTTRKPYRRAGQRAIQREIDKIMLQSGLQKNVYPHLIRHTAATHWLDSGMDLTVIQKILGHDNPQTTMIYAKLSNTEVEHAYRKYS